MWQDGYSDIGHINRSSGQIHPFGGLRGGSECAISSSLFRSVFLYSVLLCSVVFCCVLLCSVMFFSALHWACSEFLSFSVLFCTFLYFSVLFCTFLHLRLLLYSLTKHTHMHIHIHTHAHIFTDSHFLILTYAKIHTHIQTQRTCGVRCAMGLKGGCGL